ncbi:hypothetical protein CQA53_02605 [Helicobacter didelphidarum]|uniref:Toxin-antitoxin system YwqK family antitoxin n=1 Tax=Helicobacter didelphidarum TaxID=2040648 RepID=A0A3D8IPW4_9HELI|nr:toxin-antitoxin system YwqK family antitoxin [Helicobacter didelphidarum]RDU66684.1 hypothetical protein CQA53_02605 [Helicobacter didelphidarum]
MKKLAFIALCAMISVYFIGCGINKDSIPTPSSEDYSHLPECKNDEDRINGCLWIYSDESEKFRTETPIKNGEANGIVRSYLYGHTLCESKVVDSIPVSATLCFDMRGNPKNGVVKEYHENGNLAYEVEFKNGRIQGVERAYHTNGKLKAKIPYKNSKRDGVTKIYNENGNLRWETPYKDGKKDGVGKWYYENGNLMWETPHKDGKKDGVEKWYYENGNLWIETPYKDGIKDGKTKWYREDGSLDSSTQDSSNADSSPTPSSEDYSHLPECKNNEDKIKGCVERSYYQSGNLKAETPYKNDGIDGVFRLYWENGNLNSEALYRNNKIVGKIKRYREDGSLHFSLTFENNKIVSGVCSDGKEIDSNYLRRFEEKGRLDMTKIDCD